MYRFGRQMKSSRLHTTRMEHDGVGQPRHGIAKQRPAQRQQKLHVASRCARRARGVCARLSACGSARVSSCGSARVSAWPPWRPSCKLQEWSLGGGLSAPMRPQNNGYADRICAGRYRSRGRLIGSPEVGWAQREELQPRMVCKRGCVRWRQCHQMCVADGEARGQGWQQACLAGVRAHGCLVAAGMGCRRVSRVPRSSSATAVPKSMSLTCVSPLASVSKTTFSGLMSPGRVTEVTDVTACNGV